jgi:hypothetical protein
MTVEQREKATRAEIYAALTARDGTTCQHPDCGKELDFTVKDGPREVTIDHWIPQSWGYDNGWTHDEVWDLSNLKLMHKKCNASKGDLLPNEDGTIPQKKARTFKYRRDARAQRPEICTRCNAGRDLGPNEVCAACNSGPQPSRFPRYAKAPVRECDHEVFWCAFCSIGLIPRVGATEMILIGGEGGED